MNAITLDNRDIDPSLLPPLSSPRRAWHNQRGGLNPLKQPSQITR